MKFSVIWNTPKILNDLNVAFAETIELVGLEFTKSITSNIWDWPDGSKRDIVDKGGIRDSQNVIMKGPLTAEFSWSTEYAASVHQGAVLKNGTKLPPRPWTQHAMNNINVLEVFTRIFRSRQ